MHPLIQDMMQLFEGDKRAYGAYGVQLQEQEGGKLKGTAASVNGEVTVELWQKHLTGKQGLGIIPINEASKVKFAAIDVDQYPIDLVQLNQQIQKHKLPLVVCRTKSGGAHLFMFLTDWVDAEPVQRRMREYASMLGFGGSEIFPKQTRIVAERGDIGSWINVPYFDAGDTKRYAIGMTGDKLEIQDFIIVAKHIRLRPDELLVEPGKKEELLPGGPPCLNHLCSMGFPPGTRNNGLLNLGVYAKKINPDNWKDILHDYNKKFMDPPLEHSEVQGVIKSLDKKDFLYMCKQPPIAQYCNMPKCRACKHGIGYGDLGMPKFGSLTKLTTTPPIWFLEVEGGGRMELSTEELQSQRLFQQKCMATLNIMPIMPKNDGWQEIIHKLLEDATVVDMPPEMTSIGQLWQHLEDFLTSRVSAKTADDILLGKPWLNNGFYYFRFKDFMAYLERQKFREYRPSHVAVHLNEWGAQKKFWNLRGKGVNCCAFPEIKNKQDKPFDPPPQGKDVPY